MRMNHWARRNMVHAGVYAIHLIVSVDFVIIVIVPMMFSVFLLWRSSIGDIFLLLVAFLALFGAESFFPKTYQKLMTSSDYMFV